MTKEQNTQEDKMAEELAEVLAFSVEVGIMTEDEVMEFLNAMEKEAKEPKDTKDTTETKEHIDTKEGTNIESAKKQFSEKVTYKGQDIETVLSQGAFDDLVEDLHLLNLDVSYVPSSHSLLILSAKVPVASFDLVNPDSDIAKARAMMEVLSSVEDHKNWITNTMTNAPTKHTDSDSDDSMEGRLARSLNAERNDIDDIDAYIEDLGNRVVKVLGQDDEDGALYSLIKSGIYSNLGVKDLKNPNKNLAKMAEPAVDAEYENLAMPLEDLLNKTLDLFSEGSSRSTAEVLLEIKNKFEGVTLVSNDNSVSFTKIISNILQQVVKEYSIGLMTEDTDDVISSLNYLADYAMEY